MLTSFGATSRRMGCSIGSSPGLRARIVMMAFSEPDAALLDARRAATFFAMRWPDGASRGFADHPSAARK